MDNIIHTKASDNIRILSAAMVEKANSGHPGGAMGGADYIEMLYSHFLNFDPDDMSWPLRDRFFLDPGHMSPMLYSMLTLTGNFNVEELKNFRQWGSSTPGHPELDTHKGIENTSGPLGQGHTMAVGAAIAERFMVSRFGEWMAHKSYTFISDGGVQEEISQGAGRIAGYLGLSNLIMFYDSNDIQLSTTTNAVTTEDTAKKYESWGWSVVTINGNDPSAIYDALKNALSENKKPSLIIGKTIMGKGAVTESGENFERQTSTHGMPLSDAGASFGNTISNLGGDPDKPFVIFPEVEVAYKVILDQKRKTAAEKKAIHRKWAEENPELAAKFNLFINGDLPDVDFSSMLQKENAPTRGASGTVLANLQISMKTLLSLQQTCQIVTRQMDF